MQNMFINNSTFIQKLIVSIERHQYEHLLSDNELSKKLGLSGGLIGKIKSKHTNPSYQTLRKIKKGGIHIPNIQKDNKELITIQEQGPP